MDALPRRDLIGALWVRQHTDNVTHTAHTAKGSEVALDILTHCLTLLLALYVREICTAPRPYVGLSAPR